MAVIPLHPRAEDAGCAAEDMAFLGLDDRLLTARQVLVTLASYLAEFGDNFHGEIEPIHAITAQVRYGDLDGWRQICTPEQRTALLARAGQVARAYFGRAFPVVHW